MPFSRPSLTDLRTDADNDLRASLPGSDPLLRFSNLRILVTILTGMVNLLYGFLDWISRQSVPFTATDEFLYGWGGLKDVFLKAATKAGDPTTNGGGATTFSNCTPTTLIPAGTPLQRGDNVAFVTLADITIAGDGTGTGPVEAVDPGAIGNCPVGVILTLGSSISGIQSDSVVSTAVTGGADIETQDEFRSRMLQVYRNPPQGGSQSDYVKWALEVAGVTRAWCQPLVMGAGSVTVLFMEDNVRSAFGGFPQGTTGTATGETRAAHATGDQLVVANHIFPLQPVTALVYAAAPVNQAVAFTINGIADVDTRTAISEALSEVFLNTAEPGGTVNLEDLWAAMAAVPDSDGAIIVSPTTNIAASAAPNLLTLGAITWT